MPYDLVIGSCNPLALPVRLEFDPPKAYGFASSRRHIKGHLVVCMVLPWPPPLTSFSRRQMPLPQPLVSPFG